MAKRERYPARSIYKLKELDAKFKLFRSGMKVLDLGAAPGSWSLGAAERVGLSGTVLACDIQEARGVFPSNVSFFREDVFSLSAAFEEILERTAPLDAVLSDMAPSTTGARCVDQARSLELCRAALALAERLLGKGGVFVTKIFMGPDAEDFAALMRRSFSGVKAFKPASSRAESREMFYVGLGRV
jgi:23S rRNA (uridine2552-2'-O)-methyltransferase